MLSPFVIALILSSAEPSVPVFSVGGGFGIFDGFHLSTSVWLGDRVTLDGVASAGGSPLFAARIGATLRIGSGERLEGSVGLLEGSGGVAWLPDVCIWTCGRPDLPGPYAVAGLGVGYGYVGDTYEVRVLAGAFEVFRGRDPLLIPSVRVMLSRVARRGREVSE